jgi:internalin A
MEVINSVKAENKRELILCGANLTEALEKNKGQVYKAVFELKQLNLLRLSESPAFSEIDGEKLNNLTELHSLLLFGNKLAVLPGKLAIKTTSSFAKSTLSSLDISQLINLKNLDLSSNKLTSVNADLTHLTHLAAVNLSDNELSSFEIKSVTIRNLNLSKNKLEKLPQNLPVTLTEFYAAKNEITEIPGDFALPHLRILDLSENKITGVPKTLASIKFKSESYELISQ